MDSTKIYFLIFLCGLILFSCSSDKENQVYNQIKEVKESELTFFILSDTHYGKEENLDLINGKIIDAMNNLPGTAFPNPVLGSVSIPEGVVVTGDLTEGESTQWGQFVDGFGLNGEGKLLYPVFEGFGNHDGPVDGPVRSAIKKRNKQRKGLLGISANGLHYSWNWKNHHFVNLNLYPGSDWDSSCEWCHYFKESFREAEHSLEFLKKDLATNVGNSSDPIILTFHYGFDEWGSKWWTEAEQNSFYEIIGEYNVKAIFYGHTHTVQAHEWKGIPVFCVGSSQKDNEPGEFMVVKISEEEMVVIERNLNAWGKVYIKKTVQKIMSPKSP